MRKKDDFKALLYDLSVVNTVNGNKNQYVGSLSSLKYYYISLDIHYGEIFSRLLF